MDFTGIKNLVFDLGGVIINLDFSKTYNAFAQLLEKTVEETVNTFEKEHIFKLYETGKLSYPGFLDSIRSFGSPSLREKDIVNAWNALLLDIPRERIELLQRLRRKYKVFLLSNTNFTHIEKVNEILFASSGVKDLKDLFDITYLSYEIELAKPHKDIYEFVQRDAKLNPAETVFLDDTEVNLMVPEASGWKTIHVREPLTIIELLKDA
jgi:putative hydrolase of the HAD superfamily